MTPIYLAAVAAAVTLTFAHAAIHPTVAAAATTVTVNTTLDETQAGNGTCSLREATLYANGTAEPDCAAAPASGTTTITLPAGLYRLRGQALTLTGAANVVGGGAGATTIDAAGTSQVILVGVDANVTISDVTVTGGVGGQTCAFACGTNDPVNGDPGGGIENEGGTLALNRVIVTGNRTSPGATQVNCTPQIQSPCPGGAGGDGGGIANFGTTTIANSAITANSTGLGASGKPGVQSSVAFGGEAGTSGSGGRGGGIANFQTLTITNSTIAGNTTGAGGQGANGGTGVGVNGGLASSGGDGGAGGGIENDFGAQLVLSGSTISGNETGIGARGGNGGNSLANAQNVIGHGADGNPGGIGGPGGGIASDANLTISNSTIADNSISPSGASGQGGSPGGITPSQVGGANGGGIEELRMGASLTHVTIVGNRTPGFGGGVDGDGGTITVGNSIIASNQAVFDANCDGVITDQGGNVEFGDTSCAAGFLRGDPRLSSLGNHGGPTQTVALAPGSAAIHHVRTCVLSVDQRGAARPVGAACDSGAYQVAPPSIGGVSAGAITTNGATVAASVNPNLQDTTVVVNYGTTTSYGSSTTAVDLGAGNSAVTVTAALTGLAPNTTYHFDMVATNADGLTTSSDGVLTTLPPLTASIAGATTTGPALALTIACGGGTGGSGGSNICTGPISLSASDPGKHRRGRTLTVASGTYSVASGGRVTAKLLLNRKGQAMLSQHYTLLSTASVGGTTPLTTRVTFRYPLVKSPIGYTWAFAGASSVARELTVTRVPHGGKVAVTCHGRGCPFQTRTFAPRRGRVVLAPAFKHNPLHAGTTLEVKVIAANQVGEVETFEIRSGQPPAVNHECLPPGTRRPARCV
jgi:CSLREA domain-containing protein